MILFVVLKSPWVHRFIHEEQATIDNKIGARIEEQLDLDFM
jgi:hypothetical protein